MKANRLWWAVIASLIVVAGAQAQAVHRNPLVIPETKHDVSAPLWLMALNTPVQHNLNREIENHPPALLPKHIQGGVDTAVDRSVGPEVGTTKLLNFDGQNADGVAPPDTEGSVGATQFVQWVNLEYNVYDKTTGTKTLGPIQGNALWSGFGGACQNNNDGDPIVLYDKLAGRWFFAQNVFVTPYTICIAVSNTSDVTGTFTRYSFPISPATTFPDYPKWGVWPNAYFNSYRQFANGINDVGAAACAADRNAILAGTKATIQCFTKSASAYDVLLPGDLDGLTPPPDGSTDSYIGIGTDTTHISQFAFHVDFVTPKNSTFTGPTNLLVSAYTLICQNPFTRVCIPQPSPGEGLDSLGGFMMYRNAYRNFGTYESNLVSHTIKPSSPSTAVAAVRWYEIRGGVTAPTIFQQGTFQDNSSSARSFWLPTMAQDQLGDIVLGFSASSTALKPSMAYTGRVPKDATGTMEGPALVIGGTGVQESTDDRWGDYATISVDPADDCTFWYTNEYIKTTGSFNWNTRITSFKFPSCP